MGIKSRSILRSCFGISQRKPQAPEFINWIDSYWHKVEDLIPIFKIENLGATLANKADKSDIYGVLTTTLPEGTTEVLITAGTLIEKILIIDASDLLFSVGTTNGGNELVLPIDITDGHGLIACDIYFPVDTTIYFNGVTTATAIKLLKR